MGLSTREPPQKVYKIPRIILLRTTFSTPFNCSLFFVSSSHYFHLQFSTPSLSHFSNSILFSRSAHQSHSHHHHRQIAFKHLNINFLLLSSPSTGTSSPSDSVQAPQHNLFPPPKFLVRPHIFASHHQFFHLPLIISHLTIKLSYPLFSSLH